MGASGAAHVPYQGAKHLLLAFEIGVEGAEGDAAAGRAAGDRRFVIAALAKFPRRRLPQAAERLAPPFGPPRPVGGRALDQSGTGPSHAELAPNLTSPQPGPSTTQVTHIHI